MELNDDEKIRELFAGFEPETTSDAQFLDRLNRALDSVEMIRERTARQRRRNRRAVAIAALAGFASGVGVSALWSWLGPYLADLLGRLDVAELVATPVVVGVGWLLTGAIALTASLGAYDRATADRLH